MESSVAVSLFGAPVCRCHGEWCR